MKQEFYRSCRQGWRRARRTFYGLWPKWLPFVGHLKFCEWEDLREATTEIFWTTIASTAPLWFAPLILPFIFKDSKSSEEVRKTLENGELFLYSAALLGPLIYTLNKEYGEPKRAGFQGVVFRTIKFPHSPYFVGISFFILLASSVVFYIIRDPVIDVGDLLNREGISRLSAIVYILSTLIYFLASCYRKMLDAFKQKRSQRKEEDRFSDEWEEEKK